MKKNKTKDQEQKRKPRGLRLSRETIRLLNAPALLGLARGGESAGTCACPNPPNPYTEVRQNCYPIACSGTATATNDGCGQV